MHPMAPMEIRVLDDALPDPLAYLADARQRPYRDQTFGPDTFHGIAYPCRRDVAEIVEAHTRARVWFTVFRRSPLGQVEPNYIHSDETMGRFSGIYYMNTDPPEGDGTKFWQRDGDGWKMTRHVEARFNRLLIFDSGLTHSRAIFDNYGEGDGARLIQVLFLR